MREMKDSGIEWIGDVPKEWDILKLKNIANIQSGEAISKEEYEDFGLFPIIGANGIVGYVSKYNNKRKCLTTGRVGTIGTIQQIDKGWVTDNALIIYENENLMFQDFLKYIVPNFDFLEITSGTAMPLITATKLYNQFITCPPLQEQQRIADFLDEKCGEIDSLTKDIQEQIEILEEYKKSIITETVTKGLDPNVEMKDSGIEWVGAIPHDWKVNKGKYCLQCVQKPVKKDDDVITCFRDGEVTLRSKRREDGFTISMKEIGYQGIDVGDLIVHGMDGFAGAIGISDSRGKASPVLNVLETNNNKRYIMYYLRSMAYNGVFLALSTGIRVRTCDTNWGKLRELPYIIPSKNEQDDIVNYLDAKCSEIDKTIQTKKEQLETLAEYKKSLIYEYVTGKKEVK